MDSMTWHTKAWQEVFASQGKDVSTEFILQNEGSGDIFLWMKKIFDKDLDLEKNPREVEEALAYMRALGRQQRGIFLGKYKEKVCPYSGALPLLSALKKQGVPCALVTSSSRQTMEVIVPENIMDCLNATVAAEDVRKHKPEPEPYLAAAGKLKVRAQKCLVVENSPGGIKSGLSAGATAMAISSTLAPSFLSAAHQIFASLEELQAALRLA